MYVCVVTALEGSNDWNCHIEGLSGESTIYGRYGVAMQVVVCANKPEVGSC